MGKFRPLPEPIRLQDLLNSARSRTEKKINNYTDVVVAFQAYLDTFFLVVHLSLEVSTELFRFQRGQSENTHDDYPFIPRDPM